MANNLSRYEADLARLLAMGDELHHAIQYEQHPKAFREHLIARVGNRVEELIEKLPRINRSYQDWYSESKSVIRQIIPDRLDDFVRHYERNKNRKYLQWDNYVMEDYLQGLRRGDDVPMHAAITRLEQQVAILRSAEQRFKSSLFDIRQLVVADLYDSEIDSARMLAKNKFLRAAGAMAGVVLEKHLALVCENHGVKVSKKHPTIGDLNDLLRGSDIIDVPRWRANQHLADIRNLCDHNKSKEPTSEQVQDLVEGVDKVIKTVF